jgi:radical SAM superfamily enzyme YgiQ (UPF0313 family)
MAQPLGLIYVASCVRSRFPDSYDMKLMDMRLDNLNMKDIVNTALKYTPGIVGISVCSEEDMQLHETAAAIKSTLKDTVVVVGGPHATMYHRSILKDRNIDVAVIGEGEVTFTELLEKIGEGSDLGEVTGIAYNKDGRIYVSNRRNFIDNLDEIPFPAWDLIDIDKYSDVSVLNMNDVLAGRRYMGIITSRGCPYNCIFCHNMFGKKFRSRSAQNVFNEIKHLSENHGVDEIQVYDDIFNYDKKRVHDICDLLIESRLDIKLSFPNGLRGDLLDGELLLKLKKAGAYMITFALESMSERMDRLVNKYMDKEKLVENINYADKIGLITKCYFMIGFPGETLTEIREKIDFACRSSLLFASFLIVLPQIGTDLYEKVKKSFPEYETSFNQSSHYYGENEAYNKFLGLPMRKIQRRAFRKFYFNPARLAKIFVRVPRKGYFSRKLLKLLSYFV